jgi:D-lactate dehydrogenase (cytochrome)
MGLVFHAGDGNLHPMLLVPDPTDSALIQRIHRAGHEMVKCCVEMGGSLTGEHGVGIEKRELMPLMHTDDELLAMWDIKQVFDPTNLLNPGKIFPPSIESKITVGTVPWACPANPQTTVPVRLRSKFALVTSGQAQGTVPTVASVLSPATPEQAARQLLALSTERKPVFIQGTHETILPSQHADNAAHILSTQALSGIKVYAPDDLVITVGAGTLLREIQEFLAQHRQQLALVSPWPDATIGGLVATNTNAPLRMRYGALRDQVLCMTVALPDGRIIRTGRPIVKNVAGYDLTKAFIGSYGTLGLICDIALKISMRPREQRTVIIPVETIEQGMQFGQQLMQVALTASAIVLCRGNALPGYSWSNYILVYTAEGIPEDVQAELVQIRDLLATLQAPSPLETDQTTGSQLWANILHTRSKDQIVVRAGVPIKSLCAYVQECASLIDSGAWIVDIVHGFVYTMYESHSADETVRWLNALRAPALKREGYAIIMGMPAPLETRNNNLDRWGYQQDSLHIMERLKARWDAAGILNPKMFLVRKEE